MRTIPFVHPDHVPVTDVYATGVLLNPLGGTNRKPAAQHLRWGWSGKVDKNAQPEYVQWAPRITGCELARIRYTVRVADGVSRRPSQRGCQVQRSRRYVANTS
jgi:hypothetical protein